MAVFVIALLALMILILGPGAGWWLEHVDGVTGLAGKDLASAQDAIRGRLLAVATGMAALGALYYTARNADTARRALRHSEESARRTLEHSEETARRAHELSEQGQVTDRYTKAIEQLGSDKLAIRLGGVYALERIARDSPRDHPTILDVLCAFIREHSHDPHPQDGAAAGEALRTDIQAALTVIARRVAEHDDEKRGVNLIRANLKKAEFNEGNFTDARLDDANLAWAELSNANLQSANLSDANLADACLDGAYLNGAFCAFAKFVDAELRGARLVRAILTDVDFTKADLSHAELRDADLDGAILTNANLRGANLKDADLTGANLEGANLAQANLTGAKLTNVSLAGANLTAVVGLPEHLMPRAGAEKSS
ncbi:pentapeptide repeat-containing protein [Microbispora sp. H10830]|uniref:pentapeptide repeat-containing protein n=1 Tax=Microbispora sp. H10830 TaxID=2729109 RepID=UPI0016024ABB|nr:pentapeptide repeat-containing protein [Microbispora sp. H10830]